MDEYYLNRTLSDEELFFEDMQDYFESILLQGHEEDCEMEKPIEKDFSRDNIAMEGLGDDGFLDPAEMYGRQKELARLRQKKFYDAHKDKLLQKNEPNGAN